MLLRQPPRRGHGAVLGRYQLKVKPELPSPVPQIDCAFAGGSCENIREPGTDVWHQIVVDTIPEEAPTMQSSPRVYGARTCSDTRRSRLFLDGRKIAYEWFDVDEDPEALALIKSVNGGNRATPTIFFADGSFTIEPSDEELAGKLGL